MHNIRLTSIITEEGKWFVAQCPELGVFSQGQSIDKAQSNLKEAVELFLEDSEISPSLLMKSRSFLSSFEVTYA
jgi:predicted RNase H-like HicB family nuclease